MEKLQLDQILLSSLPQDFVNKARTYDRWIFRVSDIAVDLQEYLKKKRKWMLCVEKSPEEDTYWTIRLLSVRAKGENLEA